MQKIMYIITMGNRKSKCDSITATYGISKKESQTMFGVTEYVDKQVFGQNKDGSKCRKWSRKVMYN